MPKQSKAVTLLEARLAALKERQYAAQSELDLAIAMVNEVKETLTLLRDGSLQKPAKKRGKNAVPVVPEPERGGIGKL